MAQYLLTDTSSAEVIIAQILAAKEAELQKFCSEQPGPNINVPENLVSEIQYLKELV